MEITDGAAWLIGGVSGAFVAAGAWLYARISNVHDRIDKVTNHMTSEDNKLHARVDHVVDRLAQILVLDDRLQSIQKGQDKMATILDDLSKSVRHKSNNTDMVVVRLDERVKALEERK